MYHLLTMLLTRSIIFLLLVGLIPVSALSQSKTQTIRGQVLDATTRRPIVGATVTVVDLEPVIGDLTDAQGYFRLEDVPVGRRAIRCQFAGYAPYASDPLILNTTKALVLDIALREQIGESTADEVLITASDYPAQAINPLSVVSTRSFSAEETQRYPAGVNDPGRMALAFPGVQQGGDDSENDIIIRGNSSFGMLWRLEGIDIPNPNHFARPGTSGGGITVFSAQLLDRSDFSTGAMPAEYGNAISGAMDVHFRRGNMEEREYRVKIGLLGLDFATEGPIQKGRMSYLVNYRFSTLSLLNRFGFNLVGERVDNDFQDLSFNLARESKDGRGRWTFFGMGGLSQEHYRPVEDPAARETGRGDHWEDRYQGSNMLAGGMTFTRTLDDKSYIKWVVTGMGSRIYRDFDTLSLEDERYTYNTERYLDRRIATALSYSRKVSPRLRVKTGLQAHQIWFDFYRESAPRRLTDITGIGVERDLSVNGAGQTQTLQAYAQASYLLHPKLTLNGGLHAFALVLNQTGVIEPRLSMSFKPSRRHRISLAYGLHGQHLPLGAYFYDDSTGTNPNFDLPMVRSHHGVLGYQILVGKGLRLGVEGYVQRLFNVPVRADELGEQNVWWMLNNQAGIAQFPLAADGRGLNYGVDLVAEKFFSKGLFFLLTFSRFESTMELADGRIFNTRFGTKFASSYTLGKEFTFRNQSTLQIGARLLYNGGFRYTPPNLDAIPPGGAFVSDYSRVWADQVNPYSRIDARIAYRFNRPKYAGLISLDIQNVTDRRNPRGITWNSDTRLLSPRNHPSGLIPVLSFQSDF